MSSDRANEHPKRTSRTAINRRTFLRSSAALAGAAFLPAASWAQVLGANERIRFGVIGCGGMGHAHLRGLMGNPDNTSDIGRRERDNVRVNHVCEVYRRRLRSAIRYTEKQDDSAGTMEYRDVLDNPEVDVVLIATPDHWHTKIAIEAMEAGKDVYCEKPLSLTIEQAIECREAVKRTGRVLTVGPQGTSDDLYWQAQRAISSGRIGKVTWSQASYCRNSREGQFNWAIAADAGPNNAKDADGYVWWDRWLGHEWGLAEQIPWNADHFFRFRKYFAYNGGVATDLLYHKLAPLLIAITGPNGEYPKRVVASGGIYVEKDERDIPDTFIMTVDYPSEHTIVLASVMTNDVGVDDIIRGQHGTMFFSGNFDTGSAGNTLRLAEQSVFAREFRAANAGELRFPMSGESRDERPGRAYAEINKESRRDHMGNFIDAVRGQAQPHCNIDLGCSTMVAIKMGVESWRQNKVMMWDAENERVIKS